MKFIVFAGYFESIFLNQDYVPKFVEEVKRFETMLEDHYTSKRDHHKALVSSLDLALAQQIFRAKL